MIHRFIVFLFILSAAPGLAQNLSTNTTGSFMFRPQAPLNRPAVEVFYHIPEGDIKNMPILMSFHGANRNGDDYRDYWIEMANENGFMVFAPEFSSNNYPGLGDNYIMSNIFDDGDNPSPATFNDKNEWTCSVLDPLFDYIVVDISGNQQNYSAWGHSAGAQFLHRLMMYLPDTKINIAVASNAGWYTVPENEVRFPYGTQNGQLPNEDLITAFSNKLIIHLGQDDTALSTSSNGPRNNSTVNNQQGFNRLNRGRYFFETSKSTAQELEVGFNWEKHEVAGIGHSGQLMANDALQYLLPILTSTRNIEKTSLIDIYPNPNTTGILHFSNATTFPLEIAIHELSGKRVFQEVVRSNQLDVSALNSGIYLIQIIESNQLMITKKLAID